MSAVSEQLPPRIPRSLPVWPPAIRARMHDIEKELERVSEDFAANQREYDGLAEKHHFLVSEHDRLRQKLILHEFGDVADEPEVEA